MNDILMRAGVGDSPLCTVIPGGPDVMAGMDRRDVMKQTKLNIVFNLVLQKIVYLMPCGK